MSVDATPFMDLMEREGLGPMARASFRRSLASLDAADASIPETEIEPVDELTTAHDLSVPGAAIETLLDETVIIKLNGGLGTSMGLERAKSLLPVREGQSFLDLIVAQVDRMADARHGHRPRLLFMNSFSTSADTRAYLAKHHPHLGDPAGVEFVQNKVPKVDATTLGVPEWHGDPSLAWCPPGHGDLYTALAESGTLRRLLDDGVRYAFVSNADNLGATLAPELLAWFAASGAPFAMEVTRRTAADRKGGHLARRRSDGHLILRESAQTAAGDADAFADTDRHRFFNTNNLWLDLAQLADHLGPEDLDGEGRVLALPVMRNHKTLDPRDPDSPAVVQLETAMGAAIECFDDATAIVVDRSRFAPVKTTDDLFALRSDAYEIRADGSVGLVGARNGQPPSVRLDPAHHKLVDGLDELVPTEAPSLLECDSLTVQGRWRLEPGVVFVGDVVIANDEDPTDGPRSLPAGTYDA